MLYPLSYEGGRSKDSELRRPVWTEPTGANRDGQNRTKLQSAANTSAATKGDS